MCTDSRVFGHVQTGNSLLIECVEDLALLIDQGVTAVRLTDEWSNRSRSGVHSKSG
jgi:hypothetical protein